MLGGLAALEGNSHPLEDMFPSLYIGTFGTYNSFSWYLQPTPSQAIIIDGSEINL